ncbi:MAG: putative toxin-antitoxin system toxin component, PIN family [Oscillospiraceae bacterium]|nr:putative toxin-antitoxin system toxin component, PIN family [Oscillospiraceae bacterium]
MRVTVDSNILISIAVFGSKSLGKMLDCICERYTLVLSSYVVDEITRVVKEKFPGKAAIMDNLLFKLPYETEFTPRKLPKHDLFQIRDPSDEKVLYSAITADVDVLITGDNDFNNLGLERPEILKPADFITKYLA